MKRTTSNLVRYAFDALWLGVTAEELIQLDEATKATKINLDSIIDTLDENAKSIRPS
jgi:hypothetical protein